MMLGLNNETRRVTAHVLIKDEIETFTAVIKYLERQFWLKPRDIEGARLASLGPEDLARVEEELLDAARCYWHQFPVIE